MNMIALIDLISNLPKLEDEKSRKKLQLGECIKNLEIAMLIKLLNISYKRVNIEFTKGYEQLIEIMEKDTEYQENKKEKTDEYFDLMVPQSNHTMVRALLEVNAKSKEEYSYGKLVKIAYKNRDAEMIKIFVKDFLKNRNSNDYKKIVSKS